MLRSTATQQQLHRDPRQLYDWSRMEYDLDSDNNDLVVEELEDSKKKKMNIMVQLALVVVSLVLTFVIFYTLYNRRRWQQFYAARAQELASRLEQDQRDAEQKEKERTLQINAKLKIVPYSKASHNRITQPRDDATVRTRQSSSCSSTLCWSGEGGSSYSGNAGFNNSQSSETDLEAAPLPEPEKVSRPRMTMTLPKEQMSNPDLQQLEGTSETEESTTTRGSTSTSSSVDENASEDPIIAMDNDDEECCHICLTEFEDEDQLAVSNNPLCPHKYHGECIKSWLVKNDGCPVCRRPFLEESDDATSDSDIENQQQQPGGDSPADDAAHEALSSSGNEEDEDDLPSHNADETPSSPTTTTEAVDEEAAR